MSALTSDSFDAILYSSELFYADLSESKKNRIGQTQWQLVRSLEAEYADKTLIGSDSACQFKDKVWILDWNVQINWGRYEKEYPDLYPLLIMLKIATFYRHQIAKKNVNVFHGHITKFMATFGEGMRREGILAANVNQPFVPASVVTKEKINQWLFAAAERTDISSGSSGVLAIMEILVSIPKIFFYNVDILHLKTEVPWRDLKVESGQLKSLVYLSRIFGNNDSLTTKSYQPFSEQVVAGLLPPAVKLIEKHSALLIEAFDIAADSSAYQKKNSNLFHSTAREKFKLIQQTLSEDFPQWPFDEPKSYNLSRKGIENWYNLSQGAALWILMLTTALRGIDIRKNIFRDCFSPDGDADLIFYLLTDINKTKTNNHIIPVPPITITAIEYLKRTNYAPNNVPQLVVRRTEGGEGGQANSWTYPTNENINRLLRLWAAFCDQNVLDGLEDDDNPEGMAHRCRATMAGWVGTNSPLSVLIVRRLFGHKNGVMPDHYLRSNHHVQHVREEVRVKTRSDFAEQMTDAILDGNFSGGVKNTFTQGREHLKELVIQEATRNNESLTEGEMRKRLKDRIRFVLLAKLKNGELLALQTPLAFVCTRNPGSATDAPCSINSANNQRLEREIDKHFATALQMTGLPDLDNCKGANCQHSFLYDNPLSRTLLEQFKYYTMYLRGLKHTNIDLDKEAKSFVSLYTKPLIEIYPDAAKSILGHD